jgi:hypothetical protein
MSIKPSLRWAVFARDNFTCRYCGKSPPDVILHCDHVVAESKGGATDQPNLVTACGECNIGKGIKSVPIPSQPEQRAIADEVAANYPRVANTILDAAAKEANAMSVQAGGLCLSLAGMRLAAEMAHLTPLPKQISKKRFLAMCAAQFDEIGE